jgi:hypothetical protein
VRELETTGSKQASKQSKAKRQAMANDDANSSSTPTAAPAAAAPDANADADDDEEGYASAALNARELEWAINPPHLAAEHKRINGSVVRTRYERNGTALPGKKARDPQPRRPGVLLLLLLLLLLLPLSLALASSFKARGSQPPFLRRISSFFFSPCDGAWFCSLFLNNTTRVPKNRNQLLHPSSARRPLFIIILFIIRPGSRPSPSTCPLPLLLLFLSAGLVGSSLSNDGADQ